MPVWGWVIIAIVVILIIAVAAIYNGLVKLKVRVDEAWSDITVQLKRRSDLIPNLVETVKGYAKHEKETLERVIAARNACAQAGNMEDRLSSEANLSSVLKQLAVVVEQYPELKADQNFMDLQSRLNELEEEIASSRKYYNGVTKSYNIKREVFPSNIIANWFKFEKRPLFEVESEEERKAVKVQF